METQPRETSVQLAEAIFQEKWINISLVCSGVFILEGSKLSSERFEEDCIHLRKLTLNARKSRTPRFMARTIIIPVYCAKSFSNEIADYIYKSHSHRQAEIYPILFDSSTSAVLAKEAIQNDTLLIHKDLNRLFDCGISKAQEICKPDSKSIGS